MICEKCKKEHDGSYGSGRFCSINCANHRVHSEETKNKIKNSLQTYPDLFCIDCGKKLTNNCKLYKRCRKCSYGHKTGSSKYSSIPSHNGTATKYISERRKQLRIKYIQKLGGKCIKCGYNKYYGSLHFHHKNPEDKLYTLSEKHFNLSIKKIELEVEKCIVLCSNCHGEVHEFMRQGKTLEDFLQNTGQMNDILLYSTYIGELK
jgi:hypothetical protein